MEGIIILFAIIALIVNVVCIQLYPAINAFMAANLNSRLTGGNVTAEQLTPAEAKVYMARGHFAPGSMLPKVEAAVEFVESGPGRTALITLLEKAKDGVAGKTGTAIHR